jgi:hypothetical protein
MKQGEFINEYQVIHSICLNSTTHVVAQNTATEDERYRIYKINAGNVLGLADCVFINEDRDYLKTMREFIRRIGVGIDALDLDRTYRGSPDFDDIPFKAEDCFPSNIKSDYEGQVVAIKTGVLAPEYRAASHQLHIATGGFGCSPTARGRTVICKNIYDGKESAFHRADIIGVVFPERIPPWAQEKIAKIQIDKPSVIDEIKQSKQDMRERPVKPKGTPSKKKTNPEL